MMVRKCVMKRLGNTQVQERWPGTKRSKETCANNSCHTDWWKGMVTEICGPPGAQKMPSKEKTSQRVSSSTWRRHFGSGEGDAAMGQAELITISKDLWKCPLALYSLMISFLG